MGRKPILERRKLVSVRLPKRLIRDLDTIAEFNKNTRTDVMERQIREGIEKSKKLLKRKYVSFSIMVLTLTSIALYVWYLFNIR